MTIHRANPTTIVFGPKRNYYLWQMVGASIVIIASAFVGCVLVAAAANSEVPWQAQALVALICILPAALLALLVIVYTLRKSVAVLRGRRDVIVNSVDGTIAIAGRSQLVAFSEIKSITCTTDESTPRELRLVLEDDRSIRLWDANYDAALTRTAAQLANVTGAPVTIEELQKPHRPSAFATRKRDRILVGAVVAALIVFLVLAVGAVYVGRQYPDIRDTLVKMADRQNQLATFFERFSQEYAEEFYGVDVEATITYGEPTAIEIALINSPLNKLPKPEQEARAREIAQFVKDNYDGIAGIDVIVITLATDSQVLVASVSTFVSYDFETTALE